MCVAEGEDIDAPDTTLGAGPLVEEATEIKTVLAADATPYTSAKSFEDLNLSPELLKVSSRPQLPCRSHAGAAPWRSCE
jgi:hypothetical protein